MHRSRWVAILLALAVVLSPAVGTAVAGGGDGRAGREFSSVQAVLVELTSTPPPPTVSLPGDAVFLKVRPHGQERFLTCEAAAVRMLLGYVGLELPEEEIQAAFQVSDDPTEGYRGANLDGDPGGFENYGAHAPAVSKVVQHFLDREGLPYWAVWKTFPSQEEALLATYRAVQNGSPVILWMTWYARRGNVPQRKEVSVPRTVKFWWHFPPDYDRPPRLLAEITIPYTVTLVSGEHVEVVYGMEGRRLYTIDPWSYHQDGGRLVRDRPDGFYSNWDSGPAGWHYFDYAMVYLLRQR